MIQQESQTDFQHTTDAMHLQANEQTGLNEYPGTLLRSQNLTRHHLPHTSLGFAKDECRCRCLFPTLQRFQPKSCSPLRTQTHCYKALSCYVDEQISVKSGQMVIFLFFLINWLLLGGRIFFWKFSFLLDLPRI